MEKRVYPRLAEEVFWEKLPNGLTVVVLPRKGFSRKMAYFVTGVGALQRVFTMDGQNYEAPMGVAHFLEHKMFDLPGRDVASEFAALGASVNAFTSYDMTAYYFTCTDNFSQCLRLLMEFVSTPYFTEESVAKEQGIIGQEIDMNEDAPDTRVFEDLMGAMYAVHPVRETILGTRQTIAQITAQTLYDCHRAFYRPENMLLCVITDQTPESVVETARQMTQNMPTPQVKIPNTWQEPAACQKSEVRSCMEVSRPLFQLGFKCEPVGTGAEGIYREYVGDMAAEMLYGEASELYLRLYNQGIIDSTFGGGLDSLPGMAVLSASGESETPELIRDEILRQAEKILQEGISETEFLRIKRSILGSKIRSLDNFDSTCFRVCSYHFSGADYFEFPEIFEKVTSADVLEFIAKNVKKENCCLSVVAPKEETLC